MTEDKELKKIPTFLPKLNLFLIIIFAAVCVIYLSEQHKEYLDQDIKINKIEAQIARLSKSVSQVEEKVSDIDEKTKEIRIEHFLEQFNDVVDFTNTSIQELDQGFMLSEAGQSEHLTGIKFTGRVINTQSVQHRNVTFKITVSGLSKEFSINQISSGNSTRFSVYIPDLTADKARYAKIEYLRSTVSYYTK